MEPFIAKSRGRHHGRQLRPAPRYVSRFLPEFAFGAMLRVFFRVEFSRRQFNNLLPDRIPELFYQKNIAVFEHREHNSSARMLDNLSDRFVARMVSNVVNDKVHNLSGI
jgi:hypothetical protein